MQYNRISFDIDRTPVDTADEIAAAAELAPQARGFAPHHHHRLVHRPAGIICGSVAMLKYTLWRNERSA